MRKTKRIFNTVFACPKGTALLLLTWMVYSSGNKHLLQAGITCIENQSVFELANEHVSATIDKRSGHLLSLRFAGHELLATAANSPHAGGELGGYWSYVGQIQPGPSKSAWIAVNPATNKATMGEVVVAFTNNPADPKGAIDIEIHYAILKEVPGVYTYTVWRHRPGYPPFSVGEARFCVKLNPHVFDYMIIDHNRQGVMPLGQDWDSGITLNVEEARLLTTGIFRGKAEHKYDYSAPLYEIPAYGWCSSTHMVGIWIINPSFEYLGGGPTKVELTGHLDCNAGGLPTLLNMWLGSHYGGTGFSVAQEESWNKVIGPFLIYCNTNNSPLRMWKDALKMAKKQTNQWPYKWVVHPLYTPKEQRGGLAGKIIVSDRWDPHLRPSNIWVGLTSPNYTNPILPSRASSRLALNQTNTLRSNLWQRGFPPYVDWQRDSKYYQFWVRADARGNFQLRNVRPGVYWLRAIADGVPGEMIVSNIVISPGQTLNIGPVIWNPFRFGPTIWQIGIPNRGACEFRHGNHYWQWGLYYRYQIDFPNHVNFTIGKHDWRWDWNYVQPPMFQTHETIENAPIATNQTDPSRQEPTQFLGETPWTVTFTLKDPIPEKVALRIEFSGTQSGANLELWINDEFIGETGPLPPTSAMQRDSARAYSIEKHFIFDGNKLQNGTNKLVLILKAQSWSQGIIYDFLRLEQVEESSGTTHTRNNRK